MPRPSEPSNKVVAVVTKACPVCGERSEVFLPEHVYTEWHAGVHIQRAWPEASPAVRELLISGTHGDCWNLLYPEDDE